MLRQNLNFRWRSSRKRKNVRRKRPQNQVKFCYVHISTEYKWPLVYAFAICLDNWLIDTTKRHFFFISFFLCTFFFSKSFFFSGDHLEVHYEGRLDDENGKKFDASRDRGNLFKFQLGAGQVLLDSLQNYMINDLKV